ncbi:helix-turn-helix domain-containing protein [Solibacillus silvestris]
MDTSKLEMFWNDIPTEKSNAVCYEDLTKLWNTSERSVRSILHELSSFDAGDDYVLIRSARTKGFYRTDNIAEIREFKKEILNKGRSHFAPIRKINRILNANAEQKSLENNLRFYREAKGLKQSDVCAILKNYDSAIDNSMLSRFENNVCLPTPYQLAIIANIYECQPFELINADLYY